MVLFLNKKLFSILKFAILYIIKVILLLFEMADKCVNFKN